MVTDTHRYQWLKENIANGRVEIRIKTNWKSVYALANKSDLDWIIDDEIENDVLAGNSGIKAGKFTCSPPVDYFPKTFSRDYLAKRIRRIRSLNRAAIVRTDKGKFYLREFDYESGSMKKNYIFQIGE